MFTENDFAGFKEIGRGSKGDDVTSTGMFGRGALSMYHFTDVPMLISGGFFLILDPQQQLLPKNRHYRRKAGVKISLSRARRICLGQLLPFHEICGYLKDMDYYNGTLFRFCFRQSMPTELIESFTLIDARAAERLLMSYREDANLAVLFLRHVRLIEFSVRGENRSRWNVAVDRSEGYEDEIFQRLIVTSDAKDQRPEVKIWRIGITDIYESPTGIIKPGRGAGKVTECGIAACLSNYLEPQRVFCTLPTVFKSTLPVSFHASFAITGDRRTIPFESFHQDSSVTKWNMWLLNSISKFYLEFLKDLAPRLGEKSFDYWPTTRNIGSSKSLSDVVAAGFWDKLEQNAGLQLLPLARSDLSPVTPSNLTVRPGGKKRKLYPVTSLSSAQLDFFPSKTSSKIRPLLLKLCPTLVCLPRRLWSDMKTSNAFDVVTKLGPESLCNILREEINWHHLPTFLESEEEEEKVEVMEMLLETIVPVLGDDPKALNILSGCKVLPKLDGSFAVIRLANEANAECYLVATEREQELFRFAADSFVDTRPFRQRSDIQSRIISASTVQVTRNPIADIAKASLNVRNLEPADIGNLLARSSSPINKNDSTIRDSWIVRFWPYLNGRSLLDESGSRNARSTSIAEFVAIYSLQEQRICRVRCRHQWEYFSPHELANEPCILQSSADLTSKLCSQITDLKLIDRRCIPTQLSLTEYDLEDPASFARLLGAFRIIQNRLSTSINIYLASKLTAETQNVCDFLPRSINANAFRSSATWSYITYIT